MLNQPFPSNLKPLMNKQVGSGKIENEKRLQELCVMLAVRNGFRVIRFNSGAVKVGDRYVKFYTIYPENSSEGLSDLLIKKGNRAAFVELKHRNGGLRKGQKDFAEWFGEAVPVRLARSLDEFAWILSAYMDSGE